ncbi:hypothetical protein RF11_13529 [Thelohanellus kitauei]|uniref:Uncharacterized protein n=1 Tax=Thelohanellus kitauei TaxID=669202 RepID=A0A0C2IUJ1_THEKT|nr:hypothetical protein RF11_13529 [Thelohanellus kitauei]
MTVNEINEILSLHFDRKANIIAERYRFWNLKQGSTESISDFSNRCDFGDFKTQALRDCLVLGPKNKIILDGLLNMDGGMNFDRVQKRAITIESNLHSSQMIQTEEHVMKVHEGTHARGQADQKNYSQTSTCSRCGNDHRGTRCKFENAICNHRKKKGYLEREEDDMMSEQDIAYINQTTNSDRGTNEPLKKWVNIGGKTIELLIDSGAPKYSCAKIDAS